MPPIIMSPPLATDPYFDFIRLRDTKGDYVGSSWWFFETKEYNEWRYGGPQTLWINGGAGMGKTMLMMEIMIELTLNCDPSPTSPRASKVAAYFFCDRNDPRLRSATSVLRGLMHYLATYYGRHGFFSAVKGIYQTIGHTMVEDVNTFYVLSKAMQDVITCVLQFGYPIIFIVDGLDECEEGLPQLLDFISHAVLMSRVKWLISSRPRLDVRYRLMQAGRLWDLNLELNARRVSSAVEEYIDRRVEEIAEAKRYDQKTAHLIKSLLQYEANETFLWVSHACEALEKAPRYKATSTLHTLSDRLRATYRQMMDQVNQNGGETRELCKRILNAMSTATRPKRLNQVGRLALLPDEISKDMETVKDLIDRCGGFLVISGETVSLVHRSSVAEYLLSVDKVRFGRLELVDTEFLSSIEGIEEGKKA